METRAKWDVNVAFILGVTFLFMGAVYLSIAIGLFFSPEDGETIIVRSIFLPLGAGFSLSGLVLLLRAVAKKHRADQLIVDGRYVWGTVMQLQKNRSINGLHGNPVIALLHYTDAQGKLHVFRSRHLHRPPDDSILGKSARVYIQGSDYTRYYVDIEPLLSCSRNR